MTWANDHVSPGRRAQGTRLGWSCWAPSLPSGQRTGACDGGEKPAASGCWSYALRDRLLLLPPPPPPPPESCTQALALLQLFLAPQGWSWEEAGPGIRGALCTILGD